MASVAKAHYPLTRQSQKQAGRMVPPSRQRCFVVLVCQGDFTMDIQNMFYLQYYPCRVYGK